MPDYNQTFHHAGRSGIRVQLTRAHLTPQLSKLLGKLESATTKRLEAREAERTCGLGSGPERSAFAKKTREASDLERDALDALLGSSVRDKRQLSEHITDRYEAALERAQRARGELVAALAEAGEAVALYGCVQSEYAFLDIDHKVGRTPAHSRVNMAWATARDLNLTIGIDHQEQK